LLSLINGDNPKAYGQDLELFGRRRGSGETVWEIKRRIGFVSGSFHLGYLVRQRVLGTVLSGFFDTVGLYDQPSPAQVEKARTWCSRLGLAACEERFFEELSFGLQRSVLIARAMIKDPDILILDEPCQGLDDAHTETVLSAVEYIAARLHSTVLYVSHESEYDACLPSIRRRLVLIPHAEGGYTSKIETI
jgi:molybdate transport system ATP-binding protein